MKVAVLGAGAWGTALAGHLAARHDTVLWAREPALIADLSASHENARYLAGVALPPSLRYEADLSAALDHALADDALCVVATPVAGLRALFRAMRDAGTTARRLVVCAARKGFDADVAVARRNRDGPVHEWPDGWPQQRRAPSRVAAFAREVAQGLPVGAGRWRARPTACRERTPRRVPSRYDADLYWATIVGRRRGRRCGEERAGDRDRHRRRSRLSA